MKIYQTEQTTAKSRTDRPTMAFATMCKNEEHIIGTVLEAVAPYIDYLVVADTGSTDSTIDIVKDFMKKHDIPGEIHVDEWEGFDKNKNKMMGYVFDKSDYVLHLDADDIMAGDFSFNHEDAGFDNYYMTMKRGNSTWKATVIYNNRVNWKFCGVAHTIIRCIEKPNYSTGDLSDRGWVIADGVGSRAFDPKKFLYDAERLTKQFWDTLVEDPDGLNTRSVFYTAQSYMDYGKEDSYVEALKWNRIYLKLRNTWIEEEFEAQMRISICMMRIEGYSKEEIIHEMEKAIAIFPDRAEPNMKLGAYLNSIGEHELAYGYLKAAKEKDLAAVKQKYVLFVSDVSYGLHVNDELSVACYWTGRYEEGVELINEIIDDERWEFARKRIEANLNFFKQRMKENQPEDKSVDTLIIGGGITGLSTAAFLGKDHDYLVLEASDELGGYCKTIKRSGFTWDYSGHFFHFRDEEIKDYVMENMGCEVAEVEKITDIDYRGHIIDFPFQHNIAQLPEEEFLECLQDLKNLGEEDRSSFKSWIKSTLGNGICEKFLIPYNTKLYATDLDNLDADAMGRFFPKRMDVDKITDLVKSREGSYNDTFIYPEGGAYEFVKSILTRVDEGKIEKNCEVLSIDVENKVARTTTGNIKFNKLVSTTPLNRLTSMMDIDFEVLSSNKVAVLNLGFDKGTDIKSHWRYFPSSDVSFYRIGFYNNILGQDRMSLYVEVGLPTERVIDEEELTAQVMTDLAKVGIVTDQNLVDGELLVMDPAYVHITKRSERAYQEWCEEYNPMGIYSIGRYGAWTYCSIEDNIIQAREVASKINTKRVDQVPAVGVL